MKKKILIFALLLTVAVAIAVKLWFFPSVKDDYFAFDLRSLRQARAGLIVVRPTHYPFLKEKGILRAEAPSSNDHHVWLMGRNVPLRDVMAAGYDSDPLRIVLPADATTNHFDYLMTGTPKQSTEFQAVIRRKLGYVAEKQTRNTDVLALKIANATLPGVTLSRPDEKRRIHLEKEKLYFSQVPLQIMVEIFGPSLELPAVDKTDTNHYDFTIDWNSKMDQSYMEGTMTRAQAEQIVAKLGLKFVPDTASLDMLVVKKAN
jgi:uncharacterized protein (TIGR03435 family)